MSPAPATKVVLSCNYETEFGGSLVKKQQANRVKRGGTFGPEPENGILRKDAINYH